MPPVPKTGLKGPARSCSCEMEPKALTSGLRMTQYLSIITKKSSETKAGDFEILLKPWRGCARGGRRGGTLGMCWLHLPALGSNPGAKSSTNWSQPTTLSAEKVPFAETKNEECVLSIFFPGKTRYVINSAFIQTNKERVFLQINEGNNDPCAIPDFFKT